MCINTIGNEVSDELPLVTTDEIQFPNSIENEININDEATAEIPILWENAQEVNIFTQSEEDVIDIKSYFHYDIPLFGLSDDLNIKYKDLGNNELPLNSHNSIFNEEIEQAQEPFLLNNLEHILSEKKFYDQTNVDHAATANAKSEIINPHLLINDKECQNNAVEEQHINPILSDLVVEDGFEEKETILGFPGSSVELEPPPDKNLQNEFPSFKDVMSSKEIIDPLPFVNINDFLNLGDLSSFGNNVNNKTSTPENPEAGTTNVLENDRNTPLLLDNGNLTNDPSAYSESEVNAQEQGTKTKNLEMDKLIPTKNNQCINGSPPETLGKTKGDSLISSGVQQGSTEDDRQKNQLGLISELNNSIGEDKRKNVQAINLINNGVCDDKKVSFCASHICPICKRTFSKKNCLAIHSRFYHCPDRPKYHCTKCDAWFSSKKQKKDHIYSVHKDERKLKSKKGHLKDCHSCTLCEKICSTKGNLKRHLDHVHKKILKYECPHCQRKFATRYNLESHIRNMH